jgi:sigma-E factor negative regulatory protein RseB
LKLLTAFLLVLSLFGQARAQTNHDVAQWLERLHDAAHQSAYVGTFVVTTGRAMSSARIWHVCEGDEQIERVEALSGAPRSTYRRNDQVVTFFQQSRLAIAERRESLGVFPSLLNRADASIAEFYQLQALGHDRVAGFFTDVVELKPRDKWRFGYRIWTTQNTRLVVKLQTIDSLRGVLEQAAFSELQLAKPLSWLKLSTMMDNTDGYEVKKQELIRTTATQEGWNINGEIPGFRSVGCYKHASLQQAASSAPFQWVFSDGLASVSLFIETFDEKRHLSALQQENFAVGATQMIARRVGSWWLTVVGEVPLQTLEMFAARLERKK